MKTTVAQTLSTLCPNCPFGSLPTIKLNDPTVPLQKEILKACIPHNADQRDPHLATISKLLLDPTFYRQNHSAESLIAVLEHPALAVNALNYWTFGRYKEVNGKPILLPPLDEKILGTLLRVIEDSRFETLCKRREFGEIFNPLRIGAERILDLTKNAAKRSQRTSPITSRALLKLIPERQKLINDF